MAAVGAASGECLRPSARSAALHAAQVSFVLHCNDAVGRPAYVLRTGLAVAFVAPISGVLLIAKQSAANLGEAVYWRALLATSAAVLALNVLAATYSAGAGFWDARCVRLRGSCVVQTRSEAVVPGYYIDGHCVAIKVLSHPESTNGCSSVDMQP